MFLTPPPLKLLLKLPPEILRVVFDHDSMLAKVPQVMMASKAMFEFGLS